MEALVAEHFQQHPGAPLPAALDARARAALVNCDPQRWVLAPLRVVRAAARVSFNAGAALLLALHQYIEGAPLDSAERTERCGAVVDAVVPTIAARLDATLPAEARDAARLDPEALQHVDAAAHKESREPILTRFMRGVVTHGREGEPASVAASRERSATSAISAIQHGRCLMWLCPISIIFAYFVFSYTNSAAVMTALYGLGLGTPAASTLRNRVAACKEPTVAEERELLRPFDGYTAVAMADNSGHYNVFGCPPPAPPPGSGGTTRAAAARCAAARSRAPPRCPCGAPAAPVASRGRS
jgi:hypothetical protein